LSSGEILLAEINRKARNLLLIRLLEVDVGRGLL
jgi:hypothetical protein